MSAPIDRIVPFNVEAEEAVLGSLLLDPQAIVRVAAFLRPDDFYREKNRWVYESAIALYERRDAIDFLTVRDELERNGRLDETGGASFLTSLINVVPTSIHIEHYGRIVERAATRRRLISAASDIAALAYDESDEIDATLDKAEQILFAISQRSLTRDLTPISQVLNAYFDKIEYLQAHHGHVSGTTSGFVDLNKLLGGFQRSDLIIVAARPGIGKTALMLSFADAAARTNPPPAVAIFSLEMSAEQLVQRLISSATGIDQHRLRLGQIRDDELSLVTRAMGELERTRIYIDDTPGITALEMRTKARRLHAEHPIGLIIVDYLQLMHGGGRNENRVQEISHISRSLKELARELDVPVIAASQLSRAVESRHDRRPMLSDLRESGSIEQDADVVMFIYRDEYYNQNTEKKNIAEISIAKHRNGPTGMVELFFIKEQAKFADLATVSEEYSGGGSW
jgi:replicative DNA helicase